MSEEIVEKETPAQAAAPALDAIELDFSVVNVEHKTAKPDEVAAKGYTVEKSADGKTGTYKRPHVLVTGPTGETVDVVSYCGMMGRTAKSIQKFDPMRNSIIAAALISNGTALLLKAKAVADKAEQKVVGLNVARKPRKGAKPREVIKSYRVVVNYGNV